MTKTKNESGTRTMTKTVLRISQHGSKIADVASERAARKLAKELLGSSRIAETPTTDGWQYWRPSDAEDSDDAVTVEVL